MKILSPVPKGSGAIVVHRALEKAIPDYNVTGYSPLFEYAPYLLPLVARTQAGLIHTTPDYATFFARKNTPLVITFHNYILDTFMRDYSSFVQRIHYQTDLRCLTKLGLYRANAITAVSQFTANLVRRDMNFDGDIHVIYNGIDTSAFTPKKYCNNNKEVKVLFCGNLTKRKGAHLLPEIALRLDRGICLLCATGLRGGKSKFAANNIETIGKVPYNNMPQLYQSADILLMPSLREGFGLAVAEAMASGLPVIATNCSSIPELLHDGKGGYLCQPEDVGEFSQRINELAKLPKLRQEMGEYNRSRIELKFTIKQMVEHYRQLFEKLT